MSNHFYSVSNIARSDWNSQGMSAADENKETHEPCAICSGSFIVIASILCPIIMCAITFPLFLVLHHGAMDCVRGYDQIPTISGTGQYFPERLFFTYGLHLEGLILAIMFMFIYAKFRNRIAQLTKGSQPGRNLTCPTMLTYLFCFWRFSAQEKARDYQYLTFWNKTLTTLGIAAAFLSCTQYWLSRCSVWAFCTCCSFTSPSRGSWM